MKKLGIIFGGRSGEHEVSLMSATSVINALDRKKFEIICIGITRQGDWKLYGGPADKIESGEWEKSASGFNPGDLKDTVDFAFPVLHGPNGEDGTIQGLFEMLDVPYAGCGVLASSLTMDKVMAKEVFRSQGIPICSHVAATREEFIEDRQQLADKIERELSSGYPLFVKPANMGSSVGITKVKDRSALIDALCEAARYDRRIIVEETVSGRELETAVLGNAGPDVSIVGEIVPSAEFYDYNAKYLDGGKTEIIVPANIEPKIAERVRELAAEAFKAVDGAGFARVDFLYENATGKVYLSEINTIPGFTKFSMFPRLWMDTGMTYSGLLERIVELGYERYHTKNHR